MSKTYLFEQVEVGGQLLQKKVTAFREMLVYEEKEVGGHFRIQRFITERER